jgi:hypothetical protein
MSAGSIRLAGHAATAAQFLDEAADDRDSKDMAARQLAALQGIGYALLALGEQLADGTDAMADRATGCPGSPTPSTACTSHPPACAGSSHGSCQEVGSDHPRHHDRDQR